MTVTDYALRPLYSGQAPAPRETSVAQTQTQGADLWAVSWLRRLAWTQTEPLPISVFYSYRLIPLTDGASPWLLRTLRAILRLGELPENWDGEGSRRIQPAAIASAVWLLWTMDAERPPVPHIGPVSGGGIQLSWKRGHRELELEVLPDGSLAYLTMTSEEDMQEGWLRPGHEREVLTLIRWLTAEPAATLPV